MAVVMNCITMGVYWSILHEAAVIKFSKDPVYGEGRVRHMSLVHIIPGLACAINSYLTTCVMHSGLYKLMIKVSIIYSAILIVFTKATGKVFYPFLNFSDGIQSYLNLVVLTICAIAGYLLLCKLDQFLKSDLIKDRPYTVKKTFASQVFSTHEEPRVEKQSKNPGTDKKQK